MHQAGFTSRIAGTIAIVLLAILAAACAKDEGGSVLPQTTEVPTSGSATKLYKQVNGTEVEIPTDPQRIVSMVYNGELLALGIKPVGAGTSYLGTMNLFKEALDGTAEIGDGPSVEKVLELQPDLIIMHEYIDQTILDQLAKIAPVVIVPYNDRGPFERFRLFADMLGRQKEMEAFVEKFEHKAKEQKERLGNAVAPGETVAYYELYQKAISVYGEQNGRGVYNLYTVFGLTPPDNVDKLTGVEAELSLEVLPEYAADHMFIGAYSEEEEEWLDEIVQTNLWKKLPAVQNNHVYTVNQHDFHQSDVFSLYKQMDIQVDAFLGIKSGK